MTITETSRGLTVIVLFGERTSMWWVRQSDAVWQYDPKIGEWQMTPLEPSICTDKWLVTTYYSTLGENAWIARVTEQFENPLVIRWAFRPKAVSAHGEFYRDRGGTNEPMVQLSQVVLFDDGVAFDTGFDRERLLAAFPEQELLVL